jgi:predicted Zn finger-like uncharacterized protein
MNFSCPGCNLAGNIDDAKIPAQGANAICPKCKTRFLVKAVEPVDPASCFTEHTEVVAERVSASSPPITKNMEQKVPGPAVRQQNTESAMGKPSGQARTGPHNANANKGFAKNKSLMIAVAVLSAISVQWVAKSFIFASPTPVGKLQVSVPNDRFRYVSKDYDFLLVLLKERKFAELNKELSTVQEAPKQDIAKETDAENCLNVFYRPDPALESLLTAWVSEASDTYPPYLARGVYYHARAAEVRGTATADKTNDAQFAGMEKYLDLSRKDIDRALSIRSDLLMGYCYLLRMSRTLPDASLHAKEIMEKVVNLYPYSLNARWAYLGNLMPRWGGSLKEMESFVKASRAHYKGNPRLVLLEGRVDLERGDERMLFNQDYEGALQYYNKALRYGDHWFLLQQRGYALMWLNRLDEAYTDSKAALEMNPYAKESLENKAYCVFNKPELSQQGFSEVLVDLERLFSMFPDNEEYLMRRAGVRYKQREFAQAIIDYDRVLQKNPANEHAVRLKTKAAAYLQQQRK